MQRVTWEMAQEQGLSQKKACIKTSGPYAHVGAPGFYSRQACSETLRCSGRAGSDNDKIQAPLPGGRCTWISFPADSLEPPPSSEQGSFVVFQGVSLGSLARERARRARNKIQAPLPEGRGTWISFRADSLEPPPSS